MLLLNRASIKPNKCLRIYCFNCVIQCWCPTKNAPADENTCFYCSLYALRIACLRTPFWGAKKKMSSRRAQFIIISHVIHS